MPAPCSSTGVERFATVAQLRSQGEEVPEDLLEHVSPLAWEHIGLTGDYLWPRDVRGELKH